MTDDLKSSIRRALGANEAKHQMKTAVAWWRPEQWARLREVSVDRAELEETYAEWVAGANDAIRELEAAGVNIERAEVDVEELLAWCNEKGLPVDGDSRSRYAAHLLQTRSP